MPRNTRSSQTSSPDSTPTPSTEGGPVAASTGESKVDELRAFRASEEGKALIAWAQNEFTRCKTSKTPKQRQWYLNMAFNFGHQWINMLSSQLPEGIAGAFKASATPPYVKRRTINRIRSFVRAEQSKFLSTLPTVSAVPATSEEEDIRSAYASEQVWQSYSSKRKLRREYSRAIYWMVLTGTGFMKTWWDPSVTDPTSGQPGDIVYHSVDPFHIFVPNMREREVDDQPYIIQAQVKPKAWCRQQYPEELKGWDLSPSQVSGNAMLDDAFLNLTSTPKSELDACVILEIWVKPGAHQLLPQGGLLILVEDCLVGAYLEGMPYKHGQFPYTKIEHLSNDTFFADSPLVDLIELQKEYNENRTQISLAAKRMGNPQLLAQDGSIVPGRMTNEPGQIIKYRPGTPPPQPIPLQPLPEYVVRNMETILADFEDLSGQHEASRGKVPTGITAGTALAFLKETDDNYLTPQYQNIEDAFERVAKQTLGLFQEFVDLPRKLKVIGTDQAFDTALLSGADIIGEADVRVEPGSSIGQSQAAKRATVMDMFASGIIRDPNMALRLLEVGGAQKILDTVSVAERKAQRENLKMKSLATNQGVQQLQEHTQQGMMTVLSQLSQEMGPESAMMAINDPSFLEQAQSEIPPMIPADDFDMHEVHIDVHNRYRMGQEYETLPDAVKAEFDKHVEMHQMLLQESMMQQATMMGMMSPGEGDGLQSLEQAPDTMNEQPPAEQPVA